MFSYRQRLRSVSGHWDLKDIWGRNWIVNEGNTKLWVRTQRRHYRNHDRYQKMTHVEGRTANPQS